ncbi:polyadenylate-binding protein 1 isoform 1 [Reticulomyxa filosa]|uniref:Polyadenylate-binding protein 1 isoform 1 n=1 Tax=Reticulomyxa filosa TaxID=46433 RepID=X6NE49_RETFI|nr:polyadenylate-binding protein 1 isoform 1 [Reticulomyxa filosa]|eukprot:ETO24600.1 polyadenylate-binding protein 1 isoform 1 [Reticulomyxa filosa]
MTNQNETKSNQILKIWCFFFFLRIQSNQNTIHTNIHKKDTCYAFLEFESGADGKRCLETLDRRILNGHTIRVGPASRRNPYLSLTNIYVEGLPKEWGDMELRKFFEGYGSINAARVLYDKYTNESKEVGFVHFDAQEVAHVAMEDWNGKKPYPEAPREFVIKFANKGKSERKIIMHQNYARSQTSYSRMGGVVQSSSSSSSSPPYEEQYTSDPWNGYFVNDRSTTHPKFNESCKYFTRGNCKRGNACFYRHDNAGDSYGFDQGFGYDEYYPPINNDANSNANGGNYNYNYNYNQGYDYGYNTYDPMYTPLPSYSSSLLPSQTPATSTHSVAYSSTMSQPSGMYAQYTHNTGDWGSYAAPPPPTQPTTAVGTAGTASATGVPPSAMLQPNQWSSYYQQSTAVHPSQTQILSSGVAPSQVTATSSTPSVSSTAGYTTQSSYYTLPTQPTAPNTVPTQTVPPPPPSAGYGGVRSTGGLSTVNTRYHPYQINSVQTQ